MLTYGNIKIFPLKLCVITCIVTNDVIAVHSLAILVIPERRANQIPVLPPPSSVSVSSSNLQLCSSDSTPLCCRGEEAHLTEPPASCCCCLEELDRSMATSSSMSSSSISSSSSSSCSTSRASPPPRRSEASQKESQRVESDSEGLEHFLDISNDFLCIPVRTETETQFSLQDSH